MFKKLLFLMLLIPTLTFGQFKIGSVKLYDSLGTLVITAPFKTNTTTQWITRNWLPSLVVSTNSGISWSITNGLTLKLGSGLSIVNDTLVYSGSAIVTPDDSTIYWQGNRLKLKINPDYGLASDIYGTRINLSTNTGLSFDGAGKVILNLGEGIKATSNTLTLNLDTANLKYDVSGRLKVNPDINLDSIKIGSVKMTSSNGKIVSDSLKNDLIYTSRILFPTSADNYTYDLEITSDGSGNPTFLSSVGDYFNFKKAVQIYTGNLTLLNGRIEGMMGDTVASADSITLGQGNYFVITGTTTIAKMNTLGWQPGSIVTLCFSEELVLKTLTDVVLPGTCYGFQLAGGIDYTTHAGDIFVFVWSRDYWKEISRITY